jgi:hypothetical protein
VTAVLNRDVWPHLLRAVRWQLIPFAAVAAASFARLGKIDPELRLVLVATILAIGSSFVLDDAAAATLASSPSTLGRRRALRLAIAVPVTVAAWLPLLRQLSWSTHGWVRPWSASLELCTLTAVVLAIAAVACGPAADRPGGAAAPPVLLALLVVAASLPARLALFPLGGHERRWALVLSIALATLCWTGRDPASPPLRR